MHQLHLKKKKTGFSIIFRKSMQVNLKKGLLRVSELKFSHFNFHFADCAFFQPLKELPQISGSKKRTEHFFKLKLLL